ncbi:phage N-6-adenine-methyltransferase [Vibrio scophthalmi]|uniref:phage N-6-adenine-methyltransferase n=1 Tax=Vibrio scophthalmi TaxID=45658 RepID=UPI003AAD8823
MNSPQQVIYRPEHSELHQEDVFKTYQINVSRGPLVSEALHLLHSVFTQADKQFERMMLAPVRLKMPANFDGCRVSFVDEWFGYVFKHLTKMSTPQDELHDLWKQIVTKGIHVIWRPDDRSEGQYQISVNLLIDTTDKLSCEAYSYFITAFQQAIVRAYAKSLETNIEFASKHCLFPTLHPILVGKESAEYQHHIKGHFYLLSGLARLPEALLEDSCPCLATFQRKLGDSVGKNIDVMYSSARTGEKQQDRWQTPAEIFRQLNDEFHFTLDAAAEPSTALCSNYFTEQDDALAKNWGSHVVYCNPPYSKLREFARKAYEASLTGATVVMLVPARTDTQAFHHYLSKGEVRFIKGRLKFLQAGEAQNTAPFPSMICVLGAGVERKMITVHQDSLHMAMA